jgi:hypothetical protein
MVTLDRENVVVIPPRFVLGVPRPLCMANPPGNYISCYIELEVATWIHAHRGSIDYRYDKKLLENAFDASFMEPEAAMQFKMTYPPS